MGIFPRARDTKPPGHLRLTAAAGPTKKSAGRSGAAGRIGAGAAHYRHTRQTLGRIVRETGRGAG